MHFKFKYPKLLLFLLTIVIAVFLFRGLHDSSSFHSFLSSLGYFGTFLSGIFYSFGFTSAPATAVLLVLAKEQNILLAVLIGGFGALISDLLIFSFVRYSFIDEIKRLEREKIIRYLEKEEKSIFGNYYRNIFPALAGFLIASPLPTELGVTMMAGIRRISIKKFIFIAYILHCIGILIILMIGKGI